MPKRSARKSRRTIRRSKKNMKSRRSCKCSKGGMRKTRSKRGRRSMKNTRSKRGRRSMKRMRGGMKGASLTPADVTEQAPAASEQAPAASEQAPPEQAAEQAPAAPQEGSDLGGVQQGGGLIPRPLIDFTRGIEYSMKNMFNTYRGEATPVNDNPNVLRQKLSSDPQYKLTPTDINALHNNAADLVTTYQPSEPVPYNE